MSAKRIHAHSKHKHRWSRWSRVFLDHNKFLVQERYCKRCRLPERREAPPEKRYNDR